MDWIKIHIVIANHILKNNADINKIKYKISIDKKPTEELNEVFKKFD